MTSRHSRGGKATIPAPGERRPGRDLSIDSLRGVAIILMVAGHVIGGDSTEGMRVADDSSIRTSYLLLADLRIPLFTALSGYVYATRPLRESRLLRRFVTGKARRLLIPLATVGSAFTLVQALAPGTNTESDLSNWWMLFVYGQWHFWFLQAIMILLVGTGILNTLGALTTRRQTILVTVGAAVLAVVVEVPVPYNVFSVNGAIRLAPFFLVGYGVARFWPSEVPARRLLLMIAAALFGVRATQIVTHTELPPVLDGGLGIALGLVGIATLVAYRQELQVRFLAHLGYFSFAIYLLHVFGTAPTRILLERVGIVAPAPTLILCLAAGLALPVLFEVSFGRIRWVSWAFLGQKPFRGVPEGQSELAAGREEPAAVPIASETAPQESAAGKSVGRRRGSAKRVRAGKVHR